jgi:hypothetical protein
MIDKSVSPKPSTRMHEVYEISTKCIIHCGSRNSCLTFHNTKDEKAQADLVVRLAGK